MTAAHNLQIEEIREQYDRQLDKYESEELQGASRSQLDQKIKQLQKELNETTKSSIVHKGILFYCLTIKH